MQLSAPINLRKGWEMKTLHERVARLEALMLGIEPACPEKMRIARIRIVVAQAHNLTVVSLTSRCREKRFAEARFMGYYLARKFTSYALADIATAFGVTEHGAVVHGVRRCAELRDVDQSFRQKLDLLERDLKTEFEAA